MKRQRETKIMYVTFFNASIVRMLFFTYPILKRIKFYMKNLQSINPNSCLIYLYLYFETTDYFVRDIHICMHAHTQTYTHTQYQKGLTGCICIKPRNMHCCHFQKQQLISRYVQSQHLHTIP